MSQYPKFTNPSRSDDDSTNIAAHQGWWIVVAMVLAAGTGYWTGSARSVTSLNHEPPAMRTSSHAGRISVTQQSTQAVREVVERALTGAIEERRLWQQIRWLSEEEVKAALTEAAAGGMCVDSFRAYSNLPAMLFYRWGELNPVAANQQAKLMYPKKFPIAREAVITAWIKQGGSAAAWEAAMDEGEIWDCTASVRGEVAYMIVAHLGELSDMEAFKEVSRINDDDAVIAEILCRARAKKTWISPESRAEFLAAARSHPEPYIHGSAVRFLFREWVARDKEQAKAAALSMPLTDDERDNALSEIPYEERPQP